MKTGLYISFFLFSTIKFAFTPIAGPGAGLSFLETYFSCVAGGLMSAGIFYFASEFFLKRAHLKKMAKLKYAHDNGLEIKNKKRFTRTNKFIVYIKMKLGIYGVSLFAPLLLSVPIGSIVAAKFYGKEKKTFWLITIGMFGNGFLITGATYLIANFF